MMILNRFTKTMRLYLGVFPWEKKPCIHVSKISVETMLILYTIKKNPLRFFRKGWSER